MHDRLPGGERAVVVQLDFGEGDFADRFSEVCLLAESAGATVCGAVHGR